MLSSRVCLVPLRRLSYGAACDFLAAGSSRVVNASSVWVGGSDHLLMNRLRSRNDGTNLEPLASCSVFGLNCNQLRGQHQKASDELDSKNNVESAEMKPQATEVKLSQRERLKRAVREYGATVIVFHTSISLFTLGVSYAIVSSGIDVVGLMTKIGVGQSILESKLATGASTFVVAYAVHKVFAPARMACTLTATPFIVRYLRKIGFLKPPVPKA